METPPMKVGTDNTVVDVRAQCVRCRVCGERIPMPLGAARWVVRVLEAFAEAHATLVHEDKRAYFADSGAEG